MGKIRIGISGWRYDSWRGVFYPAGLPQKKELEYASRALATIEINASFYALQRPQTWARWHDQTPSGFIFSIKAPRYITHIRRLRDIEKPLANFFASGLFNLREKLGPILWQLPPGLQYDPATMAHFLDLLPRDTAQALALARRREARMSGRVRLTIDKKRRLRHAIEIRHDSFLDASFMALLRRHRVALVVADTAGRWPCCEDVTADFVYLRLHGERQLYAGGYSAAALAHWARRIGAWHMGGEPQDARRISDPAPRSARTRDMYCYFDNDVGAHAPRDAQRLIENLGLNSRR